jgi:hypothetical protein
MKCFKNSLVIAGGLAAAVFLAGAQSRADDRSEKVRPMKFHSAGMDYGNDKTKCHEDGARLRSMAKPSDGVFIRYACPGKARPGVKMIMWFPNIHRVNKNKLVLQFEYIPTVPETEEEKALPIVHKIGNGLDLKTEEECTRWETWLNQAQSKDEDEIAKGEFSVKCHYEASERGSMTWMLVPTFVFKRQNR